MSDSKNVADDGEGPSGGNFRNEKDMSGEFSFACSRTRNKFCNLMSLLM
jgi:hypothetical protein